MMVAGRVQLNGAMQPIRFAMPQLKDFTVYTAFSTIQADPSSPAQQVWFGLLLIIVLWTGGSSKCRRTDDFLVKTYNILRSGSTLTILLVAFLQFLQSADADN